MKKVTIIGAGLGGLTAGALLSKDGYRVTILEQHNIVGGCATTFKRKGGFTCEVGLHEMDGLYSDKIKKRIFDRLGVFDNIEFIRTDEFFRVFDGNDEFIMPDDVKKAIEKLVQKYPKERQGVEQYFKTIKSIYIEMNKLIDAKWWHYILFPFIFPNILKYKNKSTTESLGKIIKNDKVKKILATNTQYYNDSTDTLSFLLHSVAQYSYFSGGGWFIKGGSGRLSEYLAKVIIDNGGEVITKAKVIACDTKSVIYNHKKEQKEIKTDITISNISPMQTNELYGKKQSEKREIGDSLLTLYLGFSKNIKNVYGKLPYSNFINNNFVFVDYSQIDSGLTSQDKSFGAICTIDDIKKWENLDKQAYKNRKEELIETYLDKLEVYYPNIKDLVEYSEIGTAKTVKRYINTPNGTAYGFKPTPKQFFKPIKSKSKEIKNLYFVGQWVIAGGFSPAINSGWLCYKEIAG